MLILAGLIQSVSALHLTLNGIHPNLILVLALTWSLRYHWSEIAIWLFVAGFILDIFSGVAFGIFTVGILIVGFLGNIWQNREGINFLLSILLALPYTVVFNIIILILLFAITGLTIPRTHLISQLVFPEGLLNVIAMAFIYPLVAWLDKFERSGQLEL